MLRRADGLYSSPGSLSLSAGAMLANWLVGVCPWADNNGGLAGWRPARPPLACKTPKRPRRLRAGVPCEAVHAREEVRKSGSSDAPSALARTGQPATVWRGRVRRGRVCGRIEPSAAQRLRPAGRAPAAGSGPPARRGARQAPSHAARRVRQGRPTPLHVIRGSTNGSNQKLGACIFFWPVLKLFFSPFFGFL